ncbi:MAG: hypothetical protein AAB489_01250 [Patescibacteria group bacterium]
MFDPHLTQEKAFRDIGDVQSGESLDTLLESGLIRLYREINATRNRCYRTMQQFGESRDQFFSLFNAFRREVVASEPFRFVERYFRIYQEGSGLGESLGQDVRHWIVTCLDDVIANAAEETGRLRVQIHVTQNGVLMDVDQGEHVLPGALIERMRLQAEDLLRQLEEGMPVSELAHYVRTLRTPIGYIPPESDEADGVPYRGNGMANIIGNACFRANYVPGASENHTLVLSTGQHLKDAIRLDHGDRSVIRRLYGPGEEPVSTDALDEIFASSDF